MRRPKLGTAATPTAWEQKRIDDLVDRAPEIAVALEACCHATPCGLLICDACCDESREPFIGELLRVEDLYEGPHQIANIHLATYPAGSLGTAKIKRAHERLRKQLQRDGFTGSILIGGTEAGWSEKHKVWVLHLHLLAIGVPDEAWARLRATLGGSRPTIPLKVQPLRDIEYQISYLLKFLTCHWPGKRGPLGRGKPCPLPPDRLGELAAWWARHRFDDFVFLFGAHRRGGQIVPEL
jgi:hypothetical protein